MEQDSLFSFLEGNDKNDLFVDTVSAKLSSMLLEQFEKKLEDNEHCSAVEQVSSHHV